MSKSVKKQSRTVKGQPGYLDLDDTIALVQDQILIYSIDGYGVNQSQNTIIIYPDVWKELMKKGGDVKTKDNKYWYFEIDMTDTELEKDIKVKVEAAKPNIDLFYSKEKNDYDLDIKDSDSDWTKYWKNLMKKSLESPYNSTNGLQSKEIVIPGTRYVNQDGEIVEVEGTTIIRNDLGDISNLLNAIY